MNWQTDLPDSDTTVLLRTDCEEYPIIIGFHDGEQWRNDNGHTINDTVRGWMHLDHAAKILDR